MKTKRKDLLQSLEQVSPGLASREDIQQSDCFVFKDNHILTYNDEIAVHIKTNLDFEGAVKSKELLKLLAKLKTDEIDVKVEDSELLITDTNKKKTKSGITLQQEIVLPTNFLSMKLKYKKLPENFSQGLKVCITSTADEKVFPLFANIHIKDNTMESCDTDRATVFEMNSEMKEVLIPNTAVRQIMKYDFTHYCIKEGWMHMKRDDDCVFSCMIQNDTYPDLSGHFEVEGTAISLPDELKEELDKAVIFSDDLNNTALDIVSINIKDTIMIISSRNENGWIEIPVELKKKAKKDFEFIVSAGLLKDILSKTKKAIISDSIIRFKTKEFSHVIVLQHKDNEE